jgi:hypothetical protein
MFVVEEMHWLGIQHFVFAMGRLLFDKIASNMEKEKSYMLLVCSSSKTKYWFINSLSKKERVLLYVIMGGRAVYDVGLQRLVCWDRGLESHREHGCPSVVFVVAALATSFSMFRRVLPRVSNYV